MPKMKSHSGSKKRFKKMGSGKIKKAKAFRRHHAWAKNGKKIRQMRSGGHFEGTNEKRIQTLLPN